ncbi:MAG: 50S ribosomal protein L10 [Armatimonadetes bacterium]|nr:50S ribosomal protein L10 [Armatimonadota bacterium]
MPISRAKKEEFAEILTDYFGRCQSAVFIDYRGLTVKEMQRVRRELRAEGCRFMVAKNTLVRIALERNGLTLVDGQGQSHADLCEGLTAVAFGFERPDAPASVLLKLKSDLDEITFKGGFLGTTPVSGDAGVTRISKMRSKEDALGDLVRILKGGPSRVRMVASAAPQKLRALKRLLEEDAA